MRPPISRSTLTQSSRISKPCFIKPWKEMWQIPPVPLPMSWMQQLEQLDHTRHCWLRDSQTQRVVPQLLSIAMATLSSRSAMDFCIATILASSPPVPGTLKSQSRDPRVSRRTPSILSNFSNHYDFLLSSSPCSTLSTATISSNMEIILKKPALFGLSAAKNFPCPCSLHVHLLALLHSHCHLSPLQDGFASRSLSGCSTSFCGSSSCC